MLYDASLPEIRSIIPQADGTVYVAALGGSLAKRTQAATQASQSGSGGVTRCKARRRASLWKRRTRSPAPN